MKFALPLLLILLTSCTNPEKATALLETQGYEDIQITGFKFFGCSEDDLSRTGFIATGMNGQQVEGVVCSGWFFKGATIRFK